MMTNKKDEEQEVGERRSTYFVLALIMFCFVIFFIHHSLSCWVNVFFSLSYGSTSVCIFW